MLKIGFCPTGGSQFDCNEWNRLPNARLFAVIKIFEIENFLRDFVISSTKDARRCSKNTGSLIVDYYDRKKENNSDKNNFKIK